MECPRCNTVLKQNQLNDVNFTVEVDSCPGCGGSWFDNGELTRLEKIIEPIFFEIRKIPETKEQIKQMKCPSCSAQPYLEKIQHARDEKVIVDICNSCNGVWLDKGELEAIQKENWLVTISNLYKFFVGKN